MRRLVLACLLLGCVPPPLPPVAPRVTEEPDAAPRAAARAFLEAAAARDGARMYGLLSSRWRAEASPRRLVDDLDAGGALAQDRLSLARLALGAAGRVEGDRASFPLAPDRALLLVREPEGWRLDALP